MDLRYAQSVTYIRGEKLKSKAAKEKDQLNSYGETAAVGTTPYIAKKSMSGVKNCKFTSISRPSKYLQQPTQTHMSTPTI